MRKEFFEISKEFAWEMAHRLLNHDGKCKHLHGHSYRAKVIIQAEALIPESGSSSEGMVVDFSELASIKQWIDCVLDHRCMLQHTDPLCHHLTPEELLKVPYRPTAENIAKNIRNLVESEMIVKRVRYSKITVQVWETAKCSASAEVIV